MTTNSHDNDGSQQKKLTPAQVGYVINTMIREKVGSEPSRGILHDCLKEIAHRNNWPYENVLFWYYSYRDSVKDQDDKPIV
jgi:hypothetical protein